jgi:hypothetical protein
MSRFIDMVILAMVCSVPVIVMGLAALLIRSQTDGWGAYLICAFFLARSYVEVIAEEIRRIRDDQSN